MPIGTKEQIQMKRGMNQGRSKDVPEKQKGGGGEMKKNHLFILPVCNANDCLQQLPRAARPL